jgi:hypothetical protein
MARFTNGESVQDSRDIEVAIKEATQFLPKNFTTTHQHSKRCYRVLQHILYGNEVTVIEAKQSRLKSISPTRIVATNQRIIVVKPSFWSLWMGYNLFTPTRYEVIPYSNVANISLLTGMSFSSLSIFLTTGSQNLDGEIAGLKTGDAKAMFVFLEKMTESLRKQGREPAVAHMQSAKKAGNDVNLNVAKELVRYRGSKFVWLGTENVEYAAHMLNTDKNLVVKMEMGEIAMMDKTGAGSLEGSILVYYNDHFAYHVSDYIRETHGVGTYVLNGGIGHYGKDGGKTDGTSPRNPARRQ